MSITAKNIKGSGISPDMVIFCDMKATDNQGGEFATGDWRVRELNTILYSKQTNSNWFTLTSNNNTFTLQPGTYYINARAPAYRVNNNNALLRDTSNNVDVIDGTATYSYSVNTMCHSYSRIIGVVEITSATNYQIWHRCTVTKTVNGFGVGDQHYGTDTNNIYTYAEIMKLE